MRYMMLIHHNEAALAAAPPKELWADWAAFNEALTKAGAGMASGERLKPSSAATTVRQQDGKTAVLDGPYAETKEQLLGFNIVDCSNLDDALDVARDLGAANPGGAYEVRPVGVFRPGGKLA